jgi:DNA-directed RNA polymerase subunit RPC12/RpoP
MKNNIYKCNECGKEVHKIDNKVYCATENRYLRTYEYYLFRSLLKK